MHPTVRQQLMAAQVSDLHRDAERARVARAARRGRRTQASAGRHAVSGNRTRRLARPILTVLAARIGERAHRRPADQDAASAGPAPALAPDEAL